MAAFLALGGATAVAAGQVGVNSVGTAQLQRNAVTAGKIGAEAVKAGKLAKNAVVTDRLRDGSVTSVKLAAGAVGANQLAKAAVTAEKLGPGSVTGEVIAAGSVTAANIGAVNVRPQPNGIGAGTTELASSECGQGEKLIGVGAFWAPTASLEHFIEAEYISGNVAYVRAANKASTPSTLTVQAICLG
ncbi:MAG: hypothetical protein JST59_14365 [Actinobacteria bacterium]|nr:hypothetical protein [Actinomycetota bacterium]